MIGFLIDSGQDQQMLKNIEELSKDHLCHVFAGSLIPGVKATVLQRYEAFHFNGIIITPSFRLSQQLPHLGYCKKRFYYVRNYEWQNAQVMTYRIMKNTLLHPNTDLIVESQSQIKLIEELTNKKVKYVMSNWDVNILRQIADE